MVYYILVLFVMLLTELVVLKLIPYSSGTGSPEPRTIAPPPPAPNNNEKLHKELGGESVNPPGEWIAIPSMAPEYECSRCKQRYEWFEVGEAHYCPNCGAKMDGGPVDATIEPMTNADRIRDMSDEDLAAMLDAFCEAGECRTEDDAFCPFYDNCPHDGSIGINNAWISWLQQPAEEGEHE